MEEEKIPRKISKLVEDENGVMSNTPMKDQERTKIALNDTKIPVILDGIRQKEEIENKAWDALNKKLDIRSIVCPKCKGDGRKSNGMTCMVCIGEGVVDKEPDMRAIEMVLKPKFPNTSISVNAEIDDMTTNDLLGLIDKM
tara:strand:- start:13582 stop:14004 length:423 start_codon:yes stop_codon:yes gene_type:complete